MREPQHLLHCKPVQINWVGMSGPPSAGWQCVAECPVRQARLLEFMERGREIVGDDIVDRAKAIAAHGFSGRPST
jgi:hypothetical protein